MKTDVTSMISFPLFRITLVHNSSSTKASPSKKRNNFSYGIRCSFSTVETTTEAATTKSRELGTLKKISTEY